MRKSEDYLALDPKVTIQLKGKDYTLEMNNYAVKGILQDTGYNLLQDGFKLGHRTDPQKMGAMLYWCLKTYHPELTQEDVDKLYTYKQSPYILTKLVDCINLYMPGDETEKIEGEDAATDPQ